MRPDFREAVLQGRPQAGVWSNLGAVNASVIAAGLGYDWMLLDTEHGLGDEATLQAQLDNAAASATAAIVRIPELTDGFCKKALDLGAAGVMVPQVKTRDEAVRAARSMRYPPDGHRGVSRVNRATVFGLQTEAYLREANRAVLCVVQIETAEAVEAADAIAAVEGVDVLFVGPADLGYALGVPGETDHPRFREALVRVATACRRRGKAAGMLVGDETRLAEAVAGGFTFLACGSDAGILAAGMRGKLAALRAVMPTAG